MPAKINYEGLRFGRLLVMKEAPRRTYGRVEWICVCDCGRCTVVRGDHLVHEPRTVSCGCYHSERTREVGAARIKHGHSRSGRRHYLYSTWKCMVSRCHSPADHKYPYYGARGIAVCDRWRGDFAAFLADVGDRPAAGMSLDRINNDGNYEPANVRWATPTEQSNNRRRWGSARSDVNGRQ